MKGSKKVLALLLAVCMILSLAACGESATETSTAEEKHDTEYVTICTPPSSSAHYSLYACIPDAVASDYDWFSITCMEGAGGVVNIGRVRDNDAQIGGSTSTINFNSFYGYEDFEGQADENTRTLFYRIVSPLVVCVAKDAGVTSFADLAGQKYCPGMTGGGTIPWLEALAEYNNIDVDWMPAAMSDAIDSYSDRNIVGCAKASSGDYDSTVIQLQAARDVDIVSLTQDEVDYICEQFPSLQAYTIPAGTYDWIDHDVLTVANWAAAASSTNLSQEAGYYIVKSLSEGNGRAVRDAAMPTEAEADYPVNTLQCNSYVHAGMVQYMEELGLEVPADIIPPEYVPVK